MWLGKISVIMYIFSISLTFSGYYVDQVFALDLFTDTTSDDLEALITNHDISGETVSAEFIFGDFIAGVRVIFGIMTGSVITNAFHSLPSFNDNYDYIVRILFTASTVFLWINLVTGRDL